MKAVEDAEDEVMRNCPQTACQVRTLKLEVLYQRLTQVSNDQERQAILQEIEQVTGVKLIHTKGGSQRIAEWA